MSQIFDGDSDSDFELKTNNSYAKNYDNWRKKEELNKLRTKYGNIDDLSEDSSTSEDDDEGKEITEQLEKDFFKTLSYLKSKDPRIYDENTKFFNESPKIAKEKTKKDKPMYIKDYERKVILEKGGKFSDSEEEDESLERPLSLTYVEEQNRIKESFKKVITNSDDSDEEELGGMLKIREKSKEEKDKFEEEYKEWLKGEKEDITDKETEFDLKPLKDYWNKDDLDDGEKFLRDYILNKGFLNKKDDDYIPSYDEIINEQNLSEDEEQIDKQEEFEHKYNFRFEEPDQDFIKRYPRTIEQSLRKTDDRRKLKRQEVKERKQREKEEKKHELKQLQKLKLNEIQEKIEKLKEITGNDNIGFNDQDLESDFDPEAHDKRMQTLFNDDYYKLAKDVEKPVFKDVDDYLEIENWEKYEGEDNENVQQEPHCEDDDFNMDCDYDPTAETQKEIIESSKRKKKRKRKSNFAKAISNPKPVFDPNDKTFEEYLDEYYKFDCEDIIDNIPCRFKYRKVVPNDFGLSIEEILLAKDNELNKWSSIKKAVQYRPENVERYEEKVYKQKAQNVTLKKRILPSVFETVEENEIKVENQKKPEKVEIVKNKTKNETIYKNNDKVEIQNNNKMERKLKGKKIENNKGLTKNTEKEEVDMKKTKANVKNMKNEETLKSENEKLTRRQKRNLKKKSKNKDNEIHNKGNNDIEKKGKKRKISLNSPEKISKKIKINKKENIEISNSRLTAYGINPKKYKNKLKYGNKKS